MQFPRMPATVTAERIGWEHSLTVLKDRIRELRPLYLPPDPAGRTEYRPGELAQWDLWFPPVDIPLETGKAAHPPVVIGLTGYSRVMASTMVPTREAHDIFVGQPGLPEGLRRGANRTNQRPAPHGLSCRGTRPSAVPKLARMVRVFQVTAGGKSHKVRGVPTDATSLRFPERTSEP